MTVQELIDELNKVGDKQTDVVISTQFTGGIVKDIAITPKGVILYDWV